MNASRFVVYLTVAIALFVPPTLLADETMLQARVDQLIDRGIEFLRHQQKPDGGWHGEKEPPAITALALRAIVRDDRFNARTDFVARGYERLLSYQLEEGGIYQDILANYNTAIAISSLVAAEEPAFQPNIERAVKYLRTLQWTEQTTSAEGESIAGAEDAWFGGWGYGGRSRGPGRPDLSNTHLAIEALREAGVAADDPAIQNALKFVTRLQNNSETNPATWAGDDGGFIYGPSADRQGESFAGEYRTADGQRRLRSYGSMSYAGLKSFIYAGLSKDDPRVRAAWMWVTQNWTLDENPGLRFAGPEQATNGLYYYYHTLARALQEYDQPVITDPRGIQHDWRTELVERLARLQQPDGSWVGDRRWMEGNPILVTSYIVLALHEVKADLKRNPAQP
jgi:squalene-hopene/tetraprenyl-beta-curcumene cyclase